MSPHPNRWLGRLLLGIGVSLWLAQPCQAALAFDVVAAGNFDGTSVGYNITVANVVNRVLIVGCGFDTTVSSLTSITGAGATWAGSAFAVKTGTSLRAELWSGTTPSTGAQTVTINTAATSKGYCLVWSWNGANTTTPLNNAASAGQTTTSPINTAVTTTNGDAVVTVYANTVDAPSDGDNCNEANSPPFDGRGGIIGWETGDHCLASGGTTTIGFDFGATTNAILLSAAVQQFVADSGNQRNCTLLGICED